MRRVIAILLLAFLPFQFSWSAVATYCEHETRAGSGHPGHHEHAHQRDSSADAGSSADKAPGAVDLDCSQCHGSCAGMPALAGCGLARMVSTEAPDRFADDGSGASASARPERPQWAALA